VERFADQICEELNIKKVTLHDPKQGSFLRYEVKPNPKSLGPKFGSRLKEIQTALAAMDPAVVAEKLQAGKTLELTGIEGNVVLEASDFFQQWKAAEGWAGVVDRGTQVAVDIRITEALAQEGMAREVVRQVQKARKDAGLQMEDRIELYLGTDSAKLQAAIEAHGAYIASESLTAKWARQLLGEGAYRVEVKIEGQSLTIELRKIDRT
jgi:isoleucyl-tRNA synthetase